MDDLESLVFSIWYVARVPQDRRHLIGETKPEGFTLHQSYQLGKAKEKMLVCIIKLWDMESQETKNN